MILLWLDHGVPMVGLQCSYGWVTVLHGWVYSMGWEATSRLQPTQQCSAALHAVEKQQVFCLYFLLSEILQAAWI